MKYPILIILSSFLTVNLIAQTGIEGHILFGKFKTKYQIEVTNRCDSVVTHFNDKDARDRISFLNKDFSTKLFDNYASIACWTCNIYDEDRNRMHIEMVSILFKNSRDKEAAIQKIGSCGRQNFRKKILTRFKIVSGSDELLIVFSETIRHKLISSFMDEIVAN